MKTYSSKANAKRAAVKELSKGRGLTEAEVKAQFADLATIEQHEEGGFYWRAIQTDTKMPALRKDNHIAPATTQTPEAELPKAPDVEPFDPCDPLAGLDDPSSNRRPSEGTIVREIWDTCDALTEGLGRYPAMSDLRKVQTERGWNNHTMTTQYSRWKQFNGIRGRINAPK